MSHSGLRGRIREIAATSIFSRMLPTDFSIGTGKICDRTGAQSTETDLVIHSRTILPPVMYSERDGLFPIESCFYAIEVKSRLTAHELKDALGKGRTILELDGDVSQGMTADGRAYVRKPVLLALFAFGSDLTEGGKSELKRYAEHDPEWLSNPVLRVICVVGRGYWYFDGGRRAWIQHDASTQRDEVIDFVAGIGNSLVGKLAQRTAARLGPYLVRSRSAKVWSQATTPPTDP